MCSTALLSMSALQEPNEVRQQRQPRYGANNGPPGSFAADDQQKSVCNLQLCLLQEVEDLTQDDDALPVKRSKHFADKDVSASKSGKESAASTGTKRKSPSKPEAAKPATAKAAKASPAAKKADKSSGKDGKGRKTIVLDDDSDDDFQVMHA